MSASVRDRAIRLIRAVTGENYGDGYVVTDLAIGYAEPGYGDDETVVVFGNWNPKRFPQGDDAPLTKAENLGPRLAAALESVGVSIEWCDEWTTCADCYRAMRTAPDSYGWTMFGRFVEGAGEYICADCLRKDLESSIEPYVNNAHNALTWAGEGDLRELGFTKWEPGDPHQYENGWHPGQDDDPNAILAAIREETDADVVFLLDDVGQFDMRFSAWTRASATDKAREAGRERGSYRGDRMSARVGDRVRAWTDGRDGYRPFEVTGVLVDDPRLVYAPRVLESGDWGSCHHATNWAGIEVLTEVTR